jgi:hypothetical protein
MAAHDAHKNARASRARSALHAAYLSLGSRHLRGFDLLVHTTMMLQY